jgi:hypothetical protein
MVDGLIERRIHPYQIMAYQQAQLADYAVTFSICKTGNHQTINALKRKPF